METGDPVKLRVTEENKDGAGEEERTGDIEGAQAGEERDCEGCECPGAARKEFVGTGVGAQGGQVDRSHWQGTQQVNRPGGNPNPSGRTIRGWPLQAARPLPASVRPGHLDLLLPRPGASRGRPGDCKHPQLLPSSLWLKTGPELIPEPGLALGGSVGPDPRGPGWGRRPK